MDLENIIHSKKASNNKDLDIDSDDLKLQRKMKELEVEKFECFCCFYLAYIGCCYFVFKQMFIELIRCCFNDLIRNYNTKYFRIIIYCSTGAFWYY